MKIDFFPQWKPQQGVVEEIKDERMRQIIKKHEEEVARSRQRIQELEQEGRRLKDVKEKEGRIDFFPHGSQGRG